MGIKGEGEGGGRQGKEETKERKRDVSRADIKGTVKRK